MKKRWVFFLVALTFAIAAFFPYFLVYGKEVVRAFFDNSVPWYQIKKSLVWAAVISFAFILIITKIIVLANISKRKNIEISLLGSEEILRATLNATDNGILVVDNNRHILEANELYYNMWNIPQEVYNLCSETTNLKFIKEQLVDPDTFEAWANFTYEVPTIEHYTAKLKNESTYDVFSTPLRSKGHMIGRVWSFRDITLRINAENEL
jgi:PAS domain-containing protein